MSFILSPESHHRKHLLKPLTNRCGVQVKSIETVENATAGGHAKNKEVKEKAVSTISKKEVSAINPEPCTLFHRT